MAPLQLHETNDSLSLMISAYNGLAKIKTTQTPFAIRQLCSLISVVYVYSAPLALANEFSQLVDQLCRRRTAEHVQWRAGKLVRILGERLGGNARVHCLATVRSGAPQLSLTTLQTASRLRSIFCIQPGCPTTINTIGCPSRVPTTTIGVVRLDPPPRQKI